VKDRLTRRSISYHSNLVGGNSIDVNKYMYGGKIDLPRKNVRNGIIGPWNLNNSVNDPKISTFTSKQKMFTSKEKLGSKHDSKYSVTNTLKEQELSYMNDVFNYYEKFEDETLYNPRFQNSKKQQVKETNSIEGTLGDKDLLSFLHDRKKTKNNAVNTKTRGKVKGPFEGLANVIKKLTMKEKHLIDKATMLKDKKFLLKHPSKTASDRIGLGVVGGPVITSHVVATSLHPWIFPLLYMVAEPYMSFLVFIIITIVECIGIYVGYKLDFLGLRATDPPTFEKASSVTIIDLCADVTCSAGETCDEGLCFCGTRNTCQNEATGSFCDAENNQCKCAESVDACSNAGETCQSGVCKCGSSSTCVGQTTGSYCDASSNQCKCSASVSACTNSLETCVSGSCKCGTADTCVGQTSGTYCDATNNVCKCSSTVSACSGTTDTCDSGTCKCGTGDACSNSGETCSSGSCKCGTANTCVGQTSGTYCDATNNVCKCSSTVSACSGTSDTCDSGTCKCGTSDACSNTNELCTSGSCKCGTASTCVGQTSGTYCDATNNVCKCSSTVAACSGTTDTCDSGTCKCGTGDACSNSEETCQSGTCMCGTATSCVGLTTGAVCDATNNVCKCSATVAACSSGEECSGGTCVSK
jgi:hypothetical protein